MTNIIAFIQVSIEQSVSDEMESAKKDIKKISTILSFQKYHKKNYEKTIQRIAKETCIYCFLIFLKSTSTGFFYLFQEKLVCTYLRRQLFCRWLGHVTMYQ